MPYENLGGELVQLGPKILSHLLGFVVLGICWSFHHAALARLRRIDGTVVFLNLMLLLLVIVMPFPTILMKRRLAGRRGWGATSAWRPTLLLSDCWQARVRAS